MFPIPNISICPFYKFIQSTNPIRHRNALGRARVKVKGSERDRLLTRIASGFWLPSSRRAETTLWDGGDHRGSMHGPEWDERSLSGEPGVTRPDLGGGLKQEAAKGFRGCSRIKKMVTLPQVLGFGNWTRDATEHCALGLHGRIRNIEYFDYFDCQG